MTREAIEAILGNFRHWLETLDPPSEVGPAPDETTPDLFALIGLFTSLRQEVHLQTRSVRSLLEQHQQILKRFPSEPLGSENGSASTGVELKALLKALVDLRDAIERTHAPLEQGRAELAAGLGEAEAALGERLSEPPVKLPAGDAALPRRQGFWGRLLSRSSTQGSDDSSLWLAWVTQFHEQRQRQAALLQRSRVRLLEILDSLLAGYQMGLRRIERAISEAGLERIPTLGQRFDPETMELLDAVASDCHAPETVIEEIKPGFRWQGRLFRYALVRVAAPDHRGP